MSHPRVLLVGAALALSASACGGSNSDPAIVARATTTTSSTTTTEAPVEVESVSIEDLMVGQCSDTDDINTAGGRLALTACTAPHRYEVFAFVPRTALIIGEEGLTAAAEAGCEQISLLETGVRADGSLIRVIAFTPASGDVTCLYEAPDQRVDFFARTPLTLPPAQVTRTALPGASDDAIELATLAAGDGDEFVMVLGSTNISDPSGLDIAGWRSINGGDSFSEVDDGTLTSVGVSEVLEDMVWLGNGFLAVGTAYAGDVPQPWAAISNSTGTGWTRLAVPLAGNDGAELRFVVTRPDGGVEIVGGVYDSRSLRRPTVWTWGGFSLGQPDVLIDDEEFPDANVYVESAFADAAGITIQASNLFVPDRMGWRSTTTGEWEFLQDAPTLQFETTLAGEVEYAIRGGDLRSRPIDVGDWSRVQLPGHDGARAEVTAVAANGDGVLVVGTMPSVEGRTTAFWYQGPEGEFELIYFDLDQAGRIDQPLSATATAEGFVVVGQEDPDADEVPSAVAWTITLP